MRLTTAEKILEWARHLEWTCTECDGYPEGRCPCDTETAEYLAYCVRVTEIVEELALAEDSVRHPHPVAVNILAEAAQKEGK